MLKKTVKTKVFDQLQQMFNQDDFSSLFLIDITCNEKSGLIRVYIDGDDGVRFSDCQAISRYLEADLDSDPEVSDRYVLEVSSPGVKRSLKHFRQYPQHIGRTFKVTSLDGQAQNLKLVGVKKENLIFETIAKKNKKNRNPETIEKNIDEIKEAVVKISFK